MSEKKKSRNNDEDEDEEEDEEEEEKDSKEENNDSYRNNAAIFTLILPQLCTGLFVLLESITVLNTKIEIEKLNSSNINENSENSNMISNNHNNKNGIKNGNKNEKIDAILKDVLTGLCSTLCSLIDTPVPNNFPFLSHFQSCEKLLNLLENIPIIKNISISSYITVATSLIRQCGDHQNAPQALLSKLPHLCLYKSYEILQKNQFDPCGANFVDFDNILESFRLIRQCCISCPTILSIPITFT